MVQVGLSLSVLLFFNQLVCHNIAEVLTIKCSALGDVLFPDQKISFSPTCGILEPRKLINENNPIRKCFHLKMK